MGRRGLTPLTPIGWDARLTPVEPTRDELRDRARFHDQSRYGADARAAAALQDLLRAFDAASDSEGRFADSPLADLVRRAAGVGLGRDYSQGNLGPSESAARARRRGGYRLGVPGWDPWGADDDAGDDELLDVLDLVSAGQDGPTSHQGSVGPYQPGERPPSQGDPANDLVGRVGGAIDEWPDLPLGPAEPPGPDGPNTNDMGPDGETPGLAALRALLSRRFNSPILEWSSRPSSDPKRVNPSRNPDDQAMGPATAFVVPVSPNDEPIRAPVAGAGWTSARHLRREMWGGASPRPVSGRLLGLLSLLRRL